jgi:signal transduction histidine kinase
MTMFSTRTRPASSPPTSLDLPPAREPVAAGPFVLILVIVAATIVIGAYAAFAVDAGDRVVRGIGVIVAVAWGIAGLVIARLRREPIAIWCALVGAASGAAALSIAKYDDVASAANRSARGFTVALVPFVVAALIVALPDGRLMGRVRRVLVGAMFVATAAFGAMLAGRHGALGAAPIVLESVLFGLVAVGAFLDRHRRASPVERARMQWVGWGFVVAASLTAGVWILRGLVGWPEIAGEITVAGTVIIPVSIVLGALDRLAVRVDRLLAATIEAGGVMVMIGAVYIVVVLGFGDAPHDAERRVLGLSMVAAIIAALLYTPTRARLNDFANRRVYGERRAPDEPLQTFGARMSRAIPLDELLLQLAESLKKSMQLSAAEVWTGGDGVFECVASVPFREPGRVRMKPDEVTVVARAHVSGNAWLQVWLPDLLIAHPDKVLRVAPMAHSGELLGLIVCERDPDATPFNEEEERVLTELARQVALALHNTRLDTALQASLDELRVANEQLRASRSRIVAAADQSRRSIERNLHDGAQQRLVALAVKLGLARQLLEKSPDQVGPMLEDLRAETQSTLTELRELAHGIYPPLLMDRGLGEALVAAANRSTLPAEVRSDVARYAPDVEAAVYFCVLEAMQNAGKHAGDGSRITIDVHENDGDLCFDVADDGAGFDTTGDAVRGHGFVNMADRLGAIGGTIDVRSAPGAGTHVTGWIPKPAPLPT